MNRNWTFFSVTIIVFFVVISGWGLLYKKIYTASVNPIISACPATKIPVRRLASHTYTMPVIAEASITNQKKKLLKTKHLISLFDIGSTTRNGLAMTGTSSSFVNPYQIVFTDSYKNSDNVDVGMSDQLGSVYHFVTLPHLSRDPVAPVGPAGNKSLYFQIGTSCDNQSYDSCNGSELWRYNLKRQGQKIYSGGISTINVSDDGQYVALLSKVGMPTVTIVDSTGKLIAVYDGNQLKTLAYTIEPLKWVGHIFYANITMPQSGLSTWGTAYVLQMNADTHVAIAQDPLTTSPISHYHADQTQGKFDIQLADDVTDYTKTDILVQNTDTFDTVLLAKLKHYVPGKSIVSVVHNSLYTNLFPNCSYGFGNSGEGQYVCDKDMKQALVKYTPDSNSKGKSNGSLTVLYSGQMSWYYISTTSSYIIVDEQVPGNIHREDNLKDVLTIMNTQGKIMQQFSTQDLGLGDDAKINPLSLSGNTVWLYDSFISAGDETDHFVSLTLPQKTTSTGMSSIIAQIYNLPNQVKNRGLSFNPALEKLLYTNFSPDTYSPSLYLYDLNTNQIQTIATSNQEDYKQRWISDTTFEYALPNCGQKIQKIVN